MKKLYSVFLLVMMFAASACTSDISDNDSAAQEGKVSFTAVLHNNDESTRFEGPYPSYLSWAEEDKIIALGYDDAGNYLGKTYLYPKEYGFLTTSIEGLAIKGAAKYKMAVYSKNISLSEDKKSFVMNYDNQLQTSTEFEGADRLLFESGCVEVSEMENSAGRVDFNASNAMLEVFIFDLPEGVTSFNKVDFIINYREEGEKVIATTQYEGEYSKHQYVWAALPAGDVLRPGGTFAVRFATNLGNMVAHGVSAKGKTFESGRNYKISVTGREQSVIPNTMLKWDME